MSYQKRWAYTFFYALCLSLTVQSLGVLAVALYFGLDLQDLYGYITLILITYALVFVVIFFGIALVLKLQIQSDMHKIYRVIPDLAKNSAKADDIEALSQQLGELTSDKLKEIDILNARENYRREFLGNISHEMKTPLFSIQGFLLTLIEGGLEDENIRDKYMNRINKSVERLIFIVKDLDMIAELEKGRLTIESNPFNIVALTQEVFDLLENKADKNNVSLAFDNLYPHPIKVYGDIERIQQVLINLITNAIKHSGKNTRVTAGFEFEGDRVKIKITDNGVGIKQEHLDRIFERFYRIEKSRSRTNGGSGLGLAIVKHLLNAHNEKIYVKSEFGKGSEFFFYLKRVN